MAKPKVKPGQVWRHNESGDTFKVVVLRHDRTQQEAEGPLRSDLNTVREPCYRIAAFILTDGRWSLAYDPDGPVGTVEPVGPSVSDIIVALNSVAGDEGRAPDAAEREAISQAATLISQATSVTLAVNDIKTTYATWKAARVAISQASADMPQDEFNALFTASAIAWEAHRAACRKVAES